MHLGKTNENKKSIVQPAHSSSWSQWLEPLPAPQGPGGTRPGQGALPSRGHSHSQSLRWQPRRHTTQLTVRPWDPGGARWPQSKHTQGSEACPSTEPVVLLGSLPCSRRLCDERTLGKTTCLNALLPFTVFPGNSRYDKDRSPGATGWGAQAQVSAGWGAVPRCMGTRKDSQTSGCR